MADIQRAKPGPFSPRIIGLPVFEYCIGEASPMAWGRRVLDFRLRGRGGAPISGHEISTIEGGAALISLQHLQVRSRH